MQIFVRAVVFRLTLSRTRHKSDSRLLLPIRLLNKSLSPDDGFREILSLGSLYPVSLFGSSIDVATQFPGPVINSKALRWPDCWDANAD